MNQANRNKRENRLKDNENRKVVVVLTGSESDSVDDTSEIRLGTDGELKEKGGSVKELADHIDTAVEVGTRAVHLVKEAHAGNLMWL